jgi:SpoVK/Ycf46/Vps4 family AAA+-type ATPase
MISTLVHSTGKLGDDIIKGKSGGVIIVASGPPGVGKTLSAEVFAEYSKKGLYVVSGTELGTDPGNIEKNLSAILSRAARWGVILLLDECDAYLQKRGSSLQQNAIVGIFLKVLEYYRGVLFMTTNRGDTIDDAIMSRTVAHIQYSLPEEPQLRDIAKILMGQYNVDIEEDAFEKMVTGYSELSGRDVKGLIRLCKLHSDSIGETKISLGTLTMAAGFKGLREVSV